MRDECRRQKAECRMLTAAAVILAQAGTQPLKVGSSKLDVGSWTFNPHHPTTAAKRLGILPFPRLAPPANHSAFIILPSAFCLLPSNLPFDLKIVRYTEKMNPPTLQDAIALARTAHAGQVDKAGKDYVLHPLRIADNVEDE